MTARAITPTQTWIPARRPRRMSPRATVVWLSALAVVSLATWDWLAAVSVLLLWLAWYQLRTEDGLTVVALAFTFQWLQVCIGTLYYGITGRISPLVMNTNVRPMVIVGLACLLALLEGLVLGRRWFRTRSTSTTGSAPALLPLSDFHVFALYAISVFVQG